MCSTELRMLRECTGTPARKAAAQEMEAAAASERARMLEVTPAITTAPVSQVGGRGHQAREGRGRRSCLDFNVRPFSDLTPLLKDIYIGTTVFFSFVFLCS
tara:strand:- start:80 stop:382 length:303 start_codon:yes stop_codon:yes gene_type:complete